MNLNDLVILFQSSGLNVYKKGDCHFHNRGVVNYSFPLLENASISQEIISSLKWKFLITVIKAESCRKNTYEYILKTDDYSIRRFKRKVSNRINKSLNVCTFIRPSLEDLINYGLTINRKALKMQYNRKDRSLTSYNGWKKQATSFYNNKDVIILAAYENQKMSGYIITCEYMGRYFNHLMHYDRDMASSCPIQGLLFTLINNIISEKGSIEISDGIESYKNQPELKRFKINMLFERIPSTRVYIIHPFVIKAMQLVIYFHIRVLRKKKFKGFFLQTLLHLYKGHLNLSSIK
jgi:hypothetical protein